MAGTGESIHWIELRDVRELAAKAFKSSTYVDVWSKERLIPDLIASRIRWQARASDPTDKPVDGFWQEPDARFRIDWHENTVTRSVRAPPDSPVISGYVWDQRLYGVELAYEDVVARLPAEPDKREETHVSKVWVAAEAKRMKKAGEIPDGISITDLAKELAARMEAAAEAAAATGRSLRAVGWRHIKNKLPDWGLWPVSLIQ